MTVIAGPRRGSEFAALRREVQAARLLDRRRGHYSARIALTVLAFAAVWCGFWLVGNSWWQLAIGAALGLASTQVAFLGHDGGHRQVGRSRRVNDLLGITAGDLLVGLSFSWWVDKHNRHHAHPNVAGLDPDVRGGALVFTRAQASLRSSAFGRFAARHQAWLFFPMLTLEGLHLHLASVRWLLAGTGSRHRRAEMLLLSIHLIAYVTAVLLVLSPVKALVFVVMHQAVFGLYMGCSFAPNHKGMPTLTPDEEPDFLRRQVLTSRNVRGGWLIDLLLGGLNYQVEHHLFPNMPRPSLRRAQPLVRAYCERHGIAYTETSLIGSYVAALRHLNAVGAAAIGRTPSV